MKLVLVLLVLLLEFYQSIESSFNHCRSNSDCLTWFICHPNNQCSCGNGHSGEVVCDNARQISAVVDCHCVTCDKVSQSTFAGLCFYICKRHGSKNDFNAVMTLLPNRAEMLSNSSICNDFNRADL